MNKIDDKFARNFGFELEVFRDWFVLYTSGNGAPLIKGEVVDGRAKDVGLVFDSAYDSRLSPDLAIAYAHRIIYVAQIAKNLENLPLEKNKKEEEEEIEE